MSRAADELRIPLHSTSWINAVLPSYPGDKPGWMESAYIELGLRHRRDAGDVHRQHHHHHSGCRVDPNGHDGHCIVPLTSPVDTSAHAPMVSPARGRRASWRPISPVAGRHHKGTHTHTHTRERDLATFVEGRAPYWKPPWEPAHFLLCFPSVFRAHMRINPAWLCAQDLRRGHQQKKRGSSKFSPRNKQARTGAQVGTLVRHPRDLTGTLPKTSWWPTTFRCFGSTWLMMWTNRTIDRVPIRSTTPGPPWRRSRSPARPGVPEERKKETAIGALRRRESRKKSWDRCSQPVSRLWFCFFPSSCRWSLCATIREPHPTCGVSK